MFAFAIANEAYFQMCSVWVMVQRCHNFLFVYIFHTAFDVSTMWEVSLCFHSFLTVTLNLGGIFRDSLVYATLLLPLAWKVSVAYKKTIKIVPLIMEATNFFITTSFLWNVKTFSSEYCPQCPTYTSRRLIPPGLFNPALLVLVPWPKCWFNKCMGKAKGCWAPPTSSPSLSHTPHSAVFLHLCVPSLPAPPGAALASRILPIRVDRNFLRADILSVFCSSECLSPVAFVE